MSIKFRKATSRKTECYLVSIGEHTFGISYQTVIVYWGPLGACRRANSWGPTTGRHFSDLHATHLPVVSDDEFQLRVDRATGEAR